MNSPLVATTSDKTTEQNGTERRKSMLSSLIEEFEVKELLSKTYSLMQRCVQHESERAYTTAYVKPQRHCSIYKYFPG